MLENYIKSRLQEEYKIEYIIMWAFIFALSTLPLLVCHSKVGYITMAYALSYLLEEIFFYNFSKKFN